MNLNSAMIPLIMTGLQIVALSYLWNFFLSAVEFKDVFCVFLTGWQGEGREAQSRHNLSLISSSLSDCAQYNIVNECIEMRACMLLYLFCACDAIWSPLRSIICGVSVPQCARPQWGYFSQPSIQTWPITARLQKHFPCTQELTAVNGGYFQSLCCQSKCQVNTGQRKQL